MGLDISVYVNGEEVLYWREANWIKNWFMDFVGTEYEMVTRETISIFTLEMLLENIITILETPEDKRVNEANILMPVQSVFFFGYCAYNEDYFNSLEDTKEKLEKLISSLTEDDVIEYVDSW